MRSGDTLYVAGTCSVGLDNQVVAPGDMRGQIEHIYGIIAMALEAHGASFVNIVKEMIFVSGIEALREALPLRARFYQDAAPPAATWIQMAGFMRPEFVVEIEVTAELPANK